MSDAGAGKLYTPEILELAICLADYPVDNAASHHGNVRSRSCGSTLEISIDTGPNDAIQAIGLRVTACAIGQAAAAIFARDAIGRTQEDIRRQSEILLAWLSDGGPHPRWVGIEALDPARPYSARHDAILMPWRAAIEALSNSALAG